MTKHKMSMEAPLWRCVLVMLGLTVAFVLTMLWVRWKVPIDMIEEAQRTEKF